MNDTQELKFARYLFNHIKDELTGRCLSELLDDGPRQRFDAGVLLPTEGATLIAPLGTGIDHLVQETLLGDSAASKDKPAGIKTDSQSAMSMDFQVYLPAGTDRFRLRISPRISVWYAVIPSRAETIASQQTHLEDGSVLSDVTEEAADGADTTDADGQPDPGADPANDETVPNIDPVMAQVEVTSIAQQVADSVTLAVRGQAMGEDVIVLPRKFRKREIFVRPIEVVIDRRRLDSMLELRDELDDALAAARAAILSDDADVWRHLGAPSEGVRELHGNDILASDVAFTTALRDASGGDQALPTWRAYMTITGEEPLLTTSISAASGGHVLRMNVALVNATPALSRKEQRRAQLEEHALFDCGFSLEIEGGQLVPFEFQGTASDYRYARSFDAIGSGCVALAVPGTTNALVTETVPLYEQPWYRTRGDLQVAFADLDDRAGSAVVGVLDDIACRMDGYLQEWDEYLRGVAPSTLDSDEMAACAQDRQKFASEILDYKLGISALRRDSRLLRAFQFMNRVFYENGEQQLPPISHWRLFQLAFMVTQLPALAAREVDLDVQDEYSQQLRTALERVDVLWFPTGGGKTEAYLGLIATALFYDRLRGKRRGVTAWMRFPLRMLSLQQLERLARVVARAEIIRCREPDFNADNGDPFSIGYYVGGGNTPNRIREQNIPMGDSSERALERWQIIRSCPYCGGDVHLKFRREDWRLAHQCQNPECYTNADDHLGAMHGTLPIFIVDNEVYRYRPSVLVGTVDKLAVLGFQKHFAHLFCAVTQRCPVHGYASFGQCVEAGSNAPCTIKTRDFRKVPDNKDPVPALLIQDELHLLKEELGTFNAHYEGFLSYLPTKQGHLPSKILAATATIEAYETQTFHLYLKSANRFPQPSWREGESFYATSQPLTYRRLYAGVLTHQRSPEDAVLRSLEIYNRHIQRMRQDPRLAIEELGFDGVTEDEFLDFLHLYDLSTVYVNRKGTGGNIVYRLNQASAKDFPQLLNVTMLTGDNTMTEVGHVIQRVERERRDIDGRRLDVLVATSLISHGVDLERINFLCMAGMPSRYAEYIQASSRAARNHVGLVIVCFKRNDPRERSQYHYFMPNHRYLGRLVEPVSINRFSSFASNRTTPGLLVGMLLSHYSRVLFETKQIAKPLDNLKELRRVIDNDVLTKDQLVADLESIIGAHDVRLDEMQSRYVVDAIAQALEINWDQIQRSLETYLGDAVHPMLSFRDIDETLPFVGDGPASAFVDRIRST